MLESSRVCVQRRSQGEENEDSDKESYRQSPNSRPQSRPGSKRIDMSARISLKDETRPSTRRQEWMADDEPDEEKPRQNGSQLKSSPAEGDDDEDLSDMKRDASLSLTIDESSSAEESGRSKDDNAKSSTKGSGGRFSRDCVYGCKTFALLLVALGVIVAVVATGAILSSNNGSASITSTSENDSVPSISPRLPVDDPPTPPPNTTSTGNDGNLNTNGSADGGQDSGQGGGPIETEQPGDATTESTSTPPPTTEATNEDPRPPNTNLPPFWDGRNPNDGDSGSSNFEFSPFLVGAYYYPWHKRNFHNNEGYIRRDLLPEPQFPALGEYDDSQPEVIAQHLAWSRQANIGLWVTSWWGPDHATDQTTRDVIMDHADIGDDFKIALHYETNGRLGRRDYNLSVADKDMEYICDRYFGHSTYYRVDGRPVMFLYLARALERLDLLAQVILTMKRAAMRQCGEDLYVVGDHVFSDSPDPTSVYSSFMYLDAVTSYDVYGNMGRPSGYAGTERVDEYFEEQANWRRVAHLSGCRYIPAISPGYNDRGVRLDADHPALSRRITVDAPEGSLFGYQIAKSKELVDPIIDNLIMVNSFNEWHEDTQIEPVLGTTGSEPNILTQGLEYVGYDDLYLNILRLGTIERPGNIFDNFDYGTP